MTQCENRVSQLALDKKQLSQGVGALLKYVEKESEASSLLIDDAHQFMLQICVKKVPDVKNKIIKCVLPHSLLQSTSEVCLFVRDLDKKNRDYAPSERHFSALLAKNGVDQITKILPLKAIKLEYQPYEAKRSLSNMFDVYLADASIQRLLPGFLGKNFYGKKKFPVQVDLNSKSLKAEFDRALHTSQCIVSGRGSSCQVVVGHSSLSEDQVVENIQAALKKIAASLPGGANNIRNVHIRTEQSPAIPLFLSQGGPADVNLPVSKKRKLEEPEEVSTINGAKVRVMPDGRIQIIPDRKKDGAEPRPKKFKASNKKTKVAKKMKQTVANKAKKPLKKAAQVKAKAEKSGAGEKSSEVIEKLDTNKSEKSTKKSKISENTSKKMKGKSIDRKTMIIQQPKSLKKTKTLKNTKKSALKSSKLKGSKVKAKK